MYDREFVGAVHRLPLGNLQEVIHGTVLHEEVRVQYHSNKEFEAMAKQLKIMSDHKVHTSLCYARVALLIN